MLDKKIIEKAEKLREKILDADYKYHVLARPDIDDYKYDLMMKELMELEEKYPELITPDSPTRRVGGQPTKEFPTVTHQIPMLSLSNAYSNEELLEFDKRIKNQLKNQKYRYVCELKFDGIAISLIYRNGLFVRGATRGDGFTGDEITNNLKTVRSMPLRISSPDYQNSELNIEVRGEVYLKKDDFRKINEEQEKTGEKPYANPRNTAAGTLKLKDPKEVAKRKLNLFVYYLRFLDDRLQEKLNSHYEGLQILKKLKFPVNQYTEIHDSMEEAIKFCNRMEALREELPYEIDGVVIKIDSLEQQKILGSIAKSPRWAIAYKYKAKQAITKLKDITLQVGRIGTITPVAELQPVFLAGSTISRATLHNADEIARKDIRVGDYVKIEKGGDVIPKVIDVIKEKRTKDSKPFKMPGKCPVCGSPLVRPEGEANYYCYNYSCPAQIQGRFQHFVGRNAMDIEGLGYRIIEKFISLGYLKEIPDIYELYRYEEELKSLERFGAKSIDKLLQSIENSKKKPFDKVLFAIGIRHVGDRTATILAQHFKRIDELINATKDEIENIYEAGPKIAESVWDFFRNKNNLEIINRLKKAGLNFQLEKTGRTSGKLQNLTFVLTGTLDHYTRDEAKSLIEERGGKISSSVSSKTDYVVVGKEPGSKFAKARTLGVKVVDEKEFEELLK